MRKMLLVLSLAGLTVLASTDDAFARGTACGGGGGRRSVQCGPRRFGRRQLLCRGYGCRGRRRGLWRRRITGGGYGGGGYLGGGCSEASGLRTAHTRVTATPNYSTDARATTRLALPTTQVRQSYYPAAVQDFVNVTVLVPAADAQVWFENK